MEQPKPEEFRAKKRQEVPLHTAAKAVATAQGIVTGASIIVGISPSVTSEGGFFAAVMPWVYGGVAAIGIGVAWHTILRYGATARTVKEAVNLVLVSAIVWGMSVAVSGRYVVARVDGASAVQEREIAYVDQLGQAAQDSERKAAMDRPVIALEREAGRGLRATQDGELHYGTVSKKPGDRQVWSTLGSEAQAFENAISDQQALDVKRATELQDARVALMEARAAVAQGKDGEFVDKINKATAALKSANNVNLLDAAGSIGSGLVTDAARAPFELAKRPIDQFVQTAREKEFDVVVPDFFVKRREDAVVERPPVQGWVLACTMEGLAFLMLLLLLFGQLIKGEPALAPAE